LTIALSSQVSVDLFRFSQQVGSMLFAGLDQTTHLLHLCIEFLCKLPLLFVPPSLFQLIHVTGQVGRKLFHLFRETMQVRGKLPKMFRIGDSLVHDGFPVRGYKKLAFFD